MTERHSRDWGLDRQPTPEPSAEAALQCRSCGRKLLSDSWAHCPDCGGFLGPVPEPSAEADAALLDADGFCFSCRCAVARVHADAPEA